jgi:hypothetical protein
MADDQGWLPPWQQWWGAENHGRADSGSSCAAALRCRLPPAALAMFEEVQPPVPQWPDAPAAYLQLSEAYEDQAAKARELGWPVAERMSHHLAPLTDSALVAKSLRELLGQLRP